MGKGSFHMVCLIFIVSRMTAMLSVSGEELPPPAENRGDYSAALEKLADFTEVKSGGFYSTNRVLIRIGDHAFFDNELPGRSVAGLYLVAIHGNRILIRSHYNTFTAPGASRGLAGDIENLPGGSFIVIAAKDEATRFFDKSGREALRSIGAGRGLLEEDYRGAYLCLGIKGLKPGQAIEKWGREEQEHIGKLSGTPLEFVFPEKPEPVISREPGIHEGIIINGTEAIYYIPDKFDPGSGEYLFCIHGAGDWHRPGAFTHIHQFKDAADEKNLVVIAPVFDCLLNRMPDRKKDFDEIGRFRDRTLIRDWHLWHFTTLLNPDNNFRSDQALLDILEHFNLNLMTRREFYLYGHSGGGQFVSRFLFFHPERVKKAAISSAGSLLFPRMDRDFPNGLCMDGIKETFGPQIDPDDMVLSNEEIERKTNELLDIKLYLLVGEEETEQDPTERAWQGKNTLEKMQNYFEAMKEEHGRQKQNGRRSMNDRFRFELHIMPGVGHDALASGKLARKLLFPPKGTELEVAEHEIDHFVPEEKNLTREWIDSLYEKGSPSIFRGNELDYIGMPIGGIAAGQLYLCGDGTFGCWEMFNDHEFYGYGKESYRPRVPRKQVDQGFSILVKTAEGTRARKLCRKDFPNVEFSGGYPVGRVHYRERDFPLDIRLEAFSPFIPLNAKDSALPATLVHITIQNTEKLPLEAGVLGWLENPVCLDTARENLAGLRRTRITRGKNRTMIFHTAEDNPPDSPTRYPILLANFEGSDYGDWKTEGEAFGSRPAMGTLKGQQWVSGYIGKGLVNSYLNYDTPQGKLISPEFTINRRYMNFLIGGGNLEGKTCMNLIVNGEIVRTATGHRLERLRWQNWDLEMFEGEKARIEIVDLASGAWGHINVDYIELSDSKERLFRPSDNIPDQGSMALTLGEPAMDNEETRAILQQIRGIPGEINTDPDIRFDVRERKRTGITAPMIRLEPGQKRRFTFVLSWHFPNAEKGREYATRFRDAADAAHYLLDNHDRLSGDTLLWHDTYYDSTLPCWLLDRLHSTVSTLATGTCNWWENGRFWTWEGVLSCAGTCTHVWNYAHAMGRLFPELERCVREMQDLSVALDPETGRVGFRGGRKYAADGQCGTVLKCYREHQMSPDNAFLKRNWEAIRKVLEYSINQDANGDGLIEQSQHNTYDINFHGANTFVGSLYLAALRAGEEMALEMGDEAYARKLHAIFESGSNLSMEKLWNGEYFIQDVDLERHPRFQYASGCLSDQVFGQGWAHQLGLGYIFPEDKVKTALESVLKYNWAPDIGPQNEAHPPERWFASPGEPGLFICTWPKSPHMERDGVRYRNEIWTGIEYQVAGNMIWEGMVEEGLTLVRSIHERYHPFKRNPWNEVECGDHYVRAMASWGVFTALSGYEYHGPKGFLAFDPKITPENFKSAFTASEGWGSFTQLREGRIQKNRIALSWGRLKLNRLGLSVPENMKPSELAASIDGRMVSSEKRIEPGRVFLLFNPAIEMKAGETLQIVTSCE